MAPRFSTRREARLLFSLPVLDAGAGAGGGSGPPALSGQTRDISRTGVALVVPSLRAGGHDLSSTSRALLVELELPSGPIRFMATPVRHEVLEGDGQEAGGYLVGARITQIGGEARARLERHLRELRQG